MKRRILSVLIVMMLLGSLTMTASAIDIPNFNRRGVITVTLAHDGKPVTGGSLTIYRVADVHVENGADYSFRYTSTFAACQAPLEKLNEAKTAREIGAFIQENNITGTKVRIDNKGKAVFRNLELGLYLLIQHDASDDYEVVSPFLVSMPGKEGDTYIYDVDASPKLALKRAPKKPVLPENLPQTGLNQWPIPVMAVGGLILIVLGFACYTSGKKISHED